MINSIFNGHPAAHVMLFLAVGLFLLHWTLSSTCKLSMIALGFSMCVCVCVSVTPRLVYILCTLRGEHNIEKRNTECRLVSLGVACLSLPNVPWVLKPENYPHTHLKRENCQQTFCPACGCSWRKKGGKKQPRKTQCFRSFQALSGQLWSNMFSLCLLSLMLKLSLGKLWDGYSVTLATCIMLHTGLEGLSGILKDSGPAALLNVKPVSLGVIVLCFLYCHLPSGFYLQPSHMLTGHFIRYKVSTAH